MAAHITESIYQVNGNSLSGATTMSFSTSSFIAYPVKSAFSVGGVAMQSVIEVLPSGLNQVSTYYYTNASVYAIVASANA